MNVENLKKIKELQQEIEPKKNLNNKGVDIYDELSKIQKELKVPKDNNNTFGGYKYRTASDILLLVKKITDVPIILGDEIVQIGDRIYIKATVTFGNEKNSISNTAYAREPLSKKGMDDAQITGSCSTYARKYALQGLFAIDDSESDPDHGKPPINEEGDKNEKTKIPPKLLNKNQVETIKTKLAAYSIDENKFMEWIEKTYEINNLNQLTQNVYEYIIATIEKKKSK